MSGRDARPVLGALIAPSTAEAIIARTLAAQTSAHVEAVLQAKPELEQLILYAAEGYNHLLDATEQRDVTAYFFTLRDVDLHRRTVTGWAREGGQWVKRLVPWPDVFYDQAKRVAMGQESQALQALYASSIPINSVRSLGKWSCCNVLARFRDLLPLLPETVFYQQPEDLLSMLRRHRSVYVKPEWGSTGRGISKVWTRGEDRWGWQESVRGEVRENCTLAEVVALIKQAAGNAPIAVQQEIALYEHGGRRSDMRVGMHKDRWGEWQPERGCVRVAQAGAVATNWWRGGSSIPLPEALQVYAEGEDAANKLWERIWGSALKIATRLEEALGPMGELGLDMALDRDRRLWLIEVNPMPNKGTYDTVDGVVDSQYTYTVDYAIYLHEHRQDIGRPSINDQ